MARLIDADEVDYENIWGSQSQLHLLHRIIEMQPTVDAVEVVQCRDCKHYKTGVCLKIYYDGLASRYAWQERKPYDFCSYGERKEGAD